MIVCATAKEGEVQRDWLALEPEDTVVINCPDDIALLRGRADNLGTFFIALSTPDDLRRRVDLLIHYLGPRIQFIH